jgi:hypothetical protein
MSTFVKGGGAKTPFGRNEFLRSTHPEPRTTSYTLAKNVWPSVTIDGVVQKIAQPGTVLAKITSGTDTGKVGPYCSQTATKEVQTLTKGGTVSGGTFTLSFNGEVTTAIAYDAVAATVQAALNALTSITTVGGVVVTGGPLNTGAFSVTFNYGFDQPMLVSDVTNLTGAGAAVTVAEGTKGTAGAVDGRQTAANIVGLLYTFLPWQLLERDVEVSVVYEASVVQAWCLELNTDGVTWQALTNTTADLMKPGVLRGLGILFT